MPGVVLIAVVEGREEEEGEIRAEGGALKADRLLAAVEKRWLEVVVLSNNISGWCWWWKVSASTAEKPGQL